MLASPRRVLLRMNGWFRLDHFRWQGKERCPSGAELSSAEHRSAAVNSGAFFLGRSFKPNLHFMATPKGMQVDIDEKKIEPMLSRRSLLSASEA